jgi:oxygen-dependent protoporphyrinogen oxidase
VSQPHGRVVVVGGGIAGLAAALALLDDDGDALGRENVTVTVLEAQERAGGKIRTSPFAGVAAVDEGADAFLARVPDATDLARRVGLGERLTSPAAGSAAVWWNGLQPIPDGLMLGLPTGALSLARSRLLSLRGKLRAATEPLRPRTADADDSLGRYVRSRFGSEVHERLVDPLIGSIYATDTDRFSLDAVPQIAELASRSRSVVLAARHRPPAPPGPVFHTPHGGMGELVDAAAAQIVALGGEIRTGAPCTALERDAHGWSVDGVDADAVVLACPAEQAAGLLAQLRPVAARDLASIEYADVALVTIALPTTEWPERLAGLSGYLVPKPVQRLVTAVSFGSQKWAHWRTDDSVVLRVSLGRDALPVLHLSDETLVDACLAEVAGHLGLDLQPSATRVSRWRGAFPQYRPHHHDLVGRITASLPDTITLAGASYHGIGIPACIRSGRAAADATVRRLRAARD